MKWPAFTTALRGLRAGRVISRVLASPVLLSGLVVCGHCLAKGKHTTVTARVDKRRRDTAWYICGVKLRQRGSDCDLPRVACWLLEETIIDSLLSSVLTRDYVLRAIAEAQRELADQRPAIEAQVLTLEREVAEQEAGVRELLRLIQRQGLSALLEDEYQRANQAWSVAAARLAAAKNEAEQGEKPPLSESEVEAYLEDIRGVLREGEVSARQELLRRFVRSIVLYPNHVEVEYTFGLSTLAPLGGFGGIDSPLEGAPRAAPTIDLSNCRQLAWA